MQKERGLKEELVFEEGAKRLCPVHIESGRVHMNLIYVDQENHEFAES